jgi:prevent-host-death family protein
MDSGETMRKVGLFEAKQKLSELVERAGRGEEIGITKRGKLAAVIGPAPGHDQLEEILDGLERIRKRAKALRGVTIKDVIEEGRM